MNALKLTIPLLSQENYSNTFTRLWSVQEPLGSRNHCPAQENIAESIGFSLTKQYFINLQILMLEGPVETCVLIEKVIICPKTISGLNFLRLTRLGLERLFSDQLCLLLLVLWRMYYLRLHTYDHWKYEDENKLQQHHRTRWAISTPNLDHMIHASFTVHVYTKHLQSTQQTFANFQPHVLSCKCSMMRSIYKYQITCCYTN